MLGALSALRSNALSTAESATRGLLGTTVGFVVGGLLVLAVGTNPAVLWVLLPVAILVAGIAPALSFAAGQAGFTVTLVLLFNIVSPAGWRVGLVRVEDVAIGCAVSLIVGAVFWPRGAAARFGKALAAAYASAAAFLSEAAGSGTTVPTTRIGPTEPIDQAAAQAARAARRLDDAFREFLVERGRKRITLAEVAALLTGATALRLTAEAVRQLRTADSAGSPDTADAATAPAAQEELLAATERVTN